MKKLFSLFVALTLATSLFASNVITYTATGKLTETTEAYSSGLHTNAFNVAISTLYFFKGKGKITFAGEVTFIGDYAFYDCGGLTSIEIPNSITTIGNNAFYNCSDLTSVTIGNSVTTIGNGAFYNCGLISVMIPNSVTTIGNNAFCNCSGLTSITSYAITPPICGNGCFDNISRDIPIYVPACSVDAYKQADEWKNFTNIQADVRATITYTAVGKLPETTDCNSEGLHTNAFNVAITSHTFSNGIGTIIFSGEVTFIGDYAFYDCGGLTSIEIPNTITEIGDYAFRYCSGLKTVTIPNSVTTIGSSAFSDCIGLLSVTIGSSVTTIGNDAFYHCTGLTSVTIPNSVTTIGSYAFSGCKGLTSVTIGNSVTTIGRYAFYNCSGLTSVTIGKSVTTIGEKAFSECSGLTSVTIGKSVTTIGEKAFSGCGSLTSVTINSDSICSKTYNIGHFFGSQVTEYIIGSPVTTIGESAFYGCSGLTSVTIGNSVTTIGARAFYNCSDLTSVTIGNSVTTIGNYAFYNCKGLTSVTIGNSVTTIGSSAFEYCSGLTSVTINSNAICSRSYTSSSNFKTIFGSQVKEYIIGKPVTTIGKNAFNNCDKLTSVTISNSVTTIEECAFLGCSGLTSVTIGNSVTTIEVMAFEDCDKLTSVTIGNSVTTIGRYAFAGCSGLTKTNYTGTIADWCKIQFGDYSANPMYYSHNFFINDVEVKDLIIPDEVTKIKDDAFEYCSGLTSVTIGNSVTTIGNGAFLGCSGLTSVTIGNSVTTIGKNAFNNCDKLTSVTIPNSVTTIEVRAFVDCDKLTSVTIGNSVTTIEEGAFNYCTGLTKTNYTGTIADWCKIQFGDYSANPMCYSDNFFINDVEVKDLIIPDEVTKIKDYAFASCSGLTSVTIGNSVTSIGNYAFASCSGLTSVTIPNSVFKIGVYAFSRVNNIVYNGIATGSPWGAKCVNGYVDGYLVYSDATKTKLCGCLSAATGIITIPNSVTTIGDDAFYGCSGLTSVTIPNSVTTIGESAFYGCSGLTSITCYATNPPTCGSDCFYKVKSIPVYVPARSLNAYKQAGGWKDFYHLQGHPNDYAIVTCSATNGTIEGGGKYIKGNECIMTATANDGYHFVQWNDGNTDNPRSFIVTQDTSFIAQFAINQYILTVQSSDKTKGSVTGGGTYDYQSQLTITATANYGYRFLKWNDGNTSNPRRLTLTNDTTFIAQFTPKNYRVTVQNANPTMGSVLGSGSYSYLSAQTISATANYGYHFVQWNDGNTANPRKFTLTQDTTFIAQFAINQYTFTVQSADNIMGSVTGGGTYDYQSQLTITATANYGYCFLKWNDGITDNPRNFTLTKDSTFIAQFTPQSYQVSVQNANPTMGGVLGSGSYSYMSTQTISATANYGYHFVRWNDGITDNPRTIQVLGDTTFMAEFAKNQYLISVEAEHGKVDGGGNYDYLSSAQISATADEHYHFVKWSDGNTSNPRTISVTEDKTYTAIFALDQFTISAMVTHGAVTGTGKYDYGTEITLTVVPNVGYQFTQWNDGNTSNPRSFILTQDTSFIAQIDTIWSGVCGDKLTWKYNNGVLIISGTGAMYDYTQGKAPWMTLFKESICSLVINNGCTSIGNYAFYGLSNKDLKTIDLPNGIEQIGQYAFANCLYLKNLYLGLSLEKISANAFANDERLLYITCYAIEPPLLDESAFVNYDAYLSVPCESQDEYKVSKGWKLFNKENVSCIGAEEKPITGDEVTVNPSADNVTITWPANDNASEYKLVITKDGIVFCTLTFNAQGQLTGIAFAPNRAGSRMLDAAVMTANGWQFTVTGLDRASKYGYALDALNASKQSIKHYEGEFATDGYTSLEWVTSDKIQSVNKMLLDGHLYILRDGNLYTATGARVK